MDVTVESITDMESPSQSVLLLRPMHERVSRRNCILYIPHQSFHGLNVEEGRDDGRYGVINATNPRLEKVRTQTPLTQTQECKPGNWEPLDNLQAHERASASPGNL